MTVRIVAVLQVYKLPDLPLLRRIISTHLAEHRDARSPNARGVSSSAADNSRPPRSRRARLFSAAVRVVATRLPDPSNPHQSPGISDYPIRPCRVDPL